MFPDGQSDRLGGLRSARFHRLVSPLFGMLLRHSPNNVCYSRIVRSASIPNNIHITLVMLAHAFLAVICSQHRTDPVGDASPLPPVASIPLAIPTPQASLCLPVLNTLALPAPSVLSVS